MPADQFAPRPQPPIFLTPDDRARLAAALPPTRDVRGVGPSLLARELRRAHICEPEEMPARIVRVGSRVRYRDLVSERTVEVRLVLPEDADPVLKKLSVLSLVGAALIGLPEEQVFMFEGAGGEARALMVLDVDNDFL